MTLADVKNATFLTVGIDFSCRIREQAESTLAMARREDSKPIPHGLTAVQHQVIEGTVTVIH